MAEPNQTTPATEPQVTPAQGNQPQTFSAEYVSALRSESKGYRLAAKANEQALRTLLGVADSEELGDLNARISAFQTNAEQAKAEALQAANLRLIQAELKALPGYDTKLLERLIQLDGVQVDEAGQITGLKEAAEAVAKEFPAVCRATPVQTVSFGVPNEAGQIAADIGQRMNAAIRAARR